MQHFPKVNFALSVEYAEGKVVASARSSKKYSARDIFTRREMQRSNKNMCGHFFAMACLLRKKVFFVEKYSEIFAYLFLSKV